MVDRLPSYAAVDVSLPGPEVHRHLLSEGASHRHGSNVNSNNSSELAVHAARTCLSGPHRLPFGISSRCMRAAATLM